MGKPEAEDQAFQQETRVFVNFVVESLPVTKQKIKQCQKKDRECQELA